MAKKKSKIIQVPMPEDLLASLDALASQREESRSLVIRDAVATYVSDARKAELVRQYVEGYEKFPEVDEGDWRERLAADVWGEEDWSEDYAASKQGQPG